MRTPRLVWPAAIPVIIVVGVLCRRIVSVSEAGSGHYPYFFAGIWVFV